MLYFNTNMVATLSCGSLNGYSETTFEALRVLVDHLGERTRF